MTRGVSSRRVLAAAFGAALLAAPGRAQEPPRFTAAVEVTSIDVTVLDSSGRPIPNLTPSDFRVRVDGKDRRVVRADWVSLATDSKTAAFVPEGYSSNENMLGGRLFVIAVDQPNIRFGGGIAIQAAAGDFVDRLAPQDRVAVIGLGLGSNSVSFTSDRARIRTALSRMTGQKQAILPATHHITLAESQAIQNGDYMLLTEIQARECSQFPSRSFPDGDIPCRTEVEMEAEDLGRTLLTESETTIRGLRDLLRALREIPAPKTLILISEGFALQSPQLTVEAGALAAAAQTTLYALRLDEAMFESMMIKKEADITSDHDTRAAGLETLVAAARGTVVNLSGTGQAFFDRLEMELSGYYLLGLESDPRDRDGKAHPIRVDVPAARATVRARRQYVSLDASPPVPRTSRQQVIEGLRMPLMMSALPLRVTSFALRGPEQEKIQLLIHADIGSDYAGPTPVTVGYQLFDSQQRLLDSQATDTRLAPVMDGVPSALQFSMGASVAPGEYTLKLAVADGDKVGTIEHAIHASVDEVDGIGLSELMVGGPTAVSDLVRPTIGYTASFGSIQGYLEAYGPKVAGLKVKYEIASAENGPPLLSAEAPARRAGDSRSLFSRVVPVQQLPAGKYVMRALVSADGKPVKTLSRPFEVAPPAVLMTSAEGIGAGAPAADALFLPVADELMTHPFVREQATASATVEPFRGHVAAGAKAAFDTGLTFLEAGDYPKAEAALKQAIQPEFDSAGAMSYLAVCFAASGHDNEAVGVWQSALAEGGDLPQIYDWLGATLMRTHDLNAARSTYEEATGKWPSDARFTKPLAMIYATFGRGREAVVTLERYLGDNQQDVDALFLGVQWIYHVRAAGGVVHTRAQDLKLATSYAAAYEQAAGPQSALVQQWIAFLQK